MTAHFARTASNLLRPRRRRDLLLYPLRYAFACLPDALAAFARQHIAARWYGLRHEHCARCLLDPYHA